MSMMLEHKVRAYLSWIYRHPYLVLLASIFITAIPLHFSVLQKSTRIKIKTQVQALLPQSSPSIQASHELNQRLGSVDILVATIMSHDLDKVKTVLPELAQELEALADIRTVEWKQDIDFISQNALITFPTLEELEDAYQDLVSEIRKAVKERMRILDEDEDENTKISDAQSSTHSKYLSKVLENAIKKSESLKALAKQEGKTFAWAELESDASLSDIGRTFRSRATDYPEYFYNASYTTIGLKIYPYESSSNIAFCEKITRVVNEKISSFLEKKFGPMGDDGVIIRFDLGGGYRHALKESKRIKNDMRSSTVASFVLLALVLIIAFRSVRALFCIMIPLIMALIWTLGLMDALIGYLNLITAFIFAVLLGLGIDFGIHFYGRYREERATGLDDLEAMVHTFLHCGHASILASSTTAAAFLALTLADFKGLSQFGGVAALGVICSLLAVCIVMPAIAFAWSRWIPLKLLGYQVQRDRSGLIHNRRFPLSGKTACIGIIVGCLGLFLAPWVQMEINFDKLGPHPKASKKEVAHAQRNYKLVQRGTTRATSPTVALTNSREDGQKVYKALEKLNKDHSSRVGNIQSLFTLIPTQQKERIKAVKKLCRKLKRKVTYFKGDQRAGAEEILQHCNPQEFEETDLPPWVLKKFTDKNGEGLGQFIFISPRGSTSDGHVALDFHAQMKQIERESGAQLVVAGKVMVWAEILIALKRDGVLTFMTALSVVLLLLFAFERSWRGLLFVSAPLVLGLGLTVGIMALWEIKLNFFNVLALPTLIGMGVDDGVHMYHRYKELGPGSALYIVKTTGMSALLTTLTTSIGFASLLLADHRGLNSLGLLSMIGMLSALFATLVILPALFTYWEAYQARTQNHS